jgi:4-amino-4-deoxy-L-arabinose transferase-like glycosyltransferase
MKLSNERILIIGLLFVAFVVRVGFVLTLENRLYWSDEPVFNDIALGLLKGEGYKSGTFRANPVLPFFLASMYQIFGYNYIAPRLVQSLIGSLTVLLVFAIVQQLFSRRVAFLSSLWIALFPSLIYICGVFYVDCLLTFLIALNIYILYLNTQYEGYRSLAFLMLSGLTIGITVLCRPIFLAFLPFAIFFVVSSYRGSVAHRMIYAVALVIMTSLTILPWTFRNYILFKRVILVSSGSGDFLWRGNNELTRGDTNDRYLHPGEGGVWTRRLQEVEPTRRRELVQKYSGVQRDLESLDEIDRDRYLQRIALAFIGQNPSRALVLFIRKIGTIYTAYTGVWPTNRDNIGSTKRLVLSVIFYPTLILSLFGMLYALRQWRKYLILYLPIVSLTLAYGITTGASRFRIPIEPYIIIFASYGVVVLWDFRSYFVNLQR